MTDQTDGTNNHGITGDESIDVDTHPDNTVDGLSDRGEMHQLAEDEFLAAWAARAGTDDDAWSQTSPGPTLDAVAARITAVPAPFLDPRIDLAAVAGDILAGIRFACLEYSADARVRSGAAIGLWLIASEDLLGPLNPRLARGGVDLAVDALALRIAPLSPPLGWLTDDERRVEAARTFLLWDGYRPAGEDVSTARAMLAACDSLARNAALADAYEGHRHRAEIARRLADARAREAAARYSTE